MLYDDKVLDTLPVKISNLKQIWNEDNIFQLQKGVGLIFEGLMLSRSRHLLIDRNNDKYRYTCFHIEISKATKRAFDTNGKEIEPDFGLEKKVNTGYLSSSYKKVSKEGDDVVGPEQAVQLLSSSTLDQYNVDNVAKHTKSNVVSIWCDEKHITGIEVGDMANVRVRTKGSGPYLESIVCLSEQHKTKVNYTAADPVGSSWTEKVLNVKDDKDSHAHLTADSNAVDDDEWGD